MRRRNLISDTKFKRFESFLENHPEKTTQNVTKQLGNRVFYRFPVLWLLYYKFYPYKISLLFKQLRYGNNEKNKTTREGIWN